MIGQTLITFREVLEAALITAIILAYLARTGRVQFSRYVWYGVYTAVAASLILGAAVWFAYGALPDATKALFEAVAAFTAVIVLTSMIFWMATKGKAIKKEIERRVKVIVTRGAILALVLFSFIIVFREGLETVLFLTPTLVTDAAGTIAGVVVGTLAALALSYAIFVVGKKISIRKFFYFTSVLLVLLAAGLIGYGVHEAIEYNKDAGGPDLGWFDDSAYNLGITSDNPFHHKGAIGSVFAVMFGYSANPEWGRVVFHLAYLVVVLPLVIKVYSPERFSGFVNRVFRLRHSKKAKRGHR
ncbi:MAG: FTR1 family protein [Candidatus Hadarchaeales archaeon]